MRSRHCSNAFDNFIFLINQHLCFYFLNKVLVISKLGSRQAGRELVYSFYLLTATILLVHLPHLFKVGIFLTRIRLHFITFSTTHRYLSLWATVFTTGISKSCANFCSSISIPLASASSIIFRQGLSKFNSKTCGVNSILTQQGSIYHINHYINIFPQ